MKINRGCNLGRAASIGLALAAAGLALGGCNTTQTATNVPVAASPQPAAFASQAYTPAGFQMPEGSGCSASVARWKAIQDNDYAGGNINLKVYNQIKSEISGASSVCAAGENERSIAMIESSRRRHGYPVD